VCNLKKKISLTVFPNSGVDNEEEWEGGGEGSGGQGFGQNLYIKKKKKLKKMRHYNAV